MLVLGAFLASMSYLPEIPVQWPMPDLEVYREGVRRVLHGLDPYGSVLGSGGLPYTYPPFSLLFFMPLVVLDLDVRHISVLNTCLLGVAIWAVMRTDSTSPGRRRLGLTARNAVLGAGVLLLSQYLQPVRSNVTLGQVNVLLMALVSVDLLRVAGRFRGAAAGVAAMVKLTPLVFLIHPWWQHDKRGLRNFLLAAVACLVLALLVMPASSWDYFGHHLLDQNRPGHTYPGATFNQSLRGLALRLVGPGGRPTGESQIPLTADLLWILMAAGTVGLLMVALRGLRRHEDAALALGYIAIAGLLVSPISWTHHWVWVVPLTAALVLSVRNYPWVALPITLLNLVMLGEPWLISHWYVIDGEGPALRLAGGNAYVLAGVATLVVGAMYGGANAWRNGERPD